MAAQSKGTCASVVEPEKDLRKEPRQGLSPGGRAPNLWTTQVLFRCSLLFPELPAVLARPPPLLLWISAQPPSCRKVLPKPCDLCFRQQLTFLVLWSEEANVFCGLAAEGSSSSEQVPCATLAHGIQGYSWLFLSLTNLPGEASGSKPQTQG